MSFTGWRRSGVGRVLTVNRSVVSYVEARLGQNTKGNRPEKLHYHRSL